ncbi:MAG: cobalamin-binding protein [Desulfobulbaceae bacterium]|nr:cobalamin-binding protein [Desulfobulbaceae bacterium]
MLENIVKAYNEAIFDTDRDQALAVIHQALARGVTPEEIVFQVVVPAIEQMVKAISQDFDANLAQHFMTAQIAAEITEEMLTKFQRPPEIVGRMVIGTAYGDLHTLGKRIVMGCLKSMMIEVTDLGVNVPAEKFVDEACARGAEVIGISAMMVHTARGDQGCLQVRQLLRERGLEERIKIVVGGAPYRYDPELYRLVGADAWAEDAITGGKVINELIKKVREANQ